MKIRDIPGYEGRYGATEGGGIFSYRYGAPHCLKPQVSTGGYLKVMLYDKGAPKWAYVHRLVAETFLPNPKGCRVVNHIDANPQNCSASNLEWVDQSANIAHSRKLGNQNKDKPVCITSAAGEVFRFGNMREASKEIFGAPLILRGQYRRKGNEFIYHGFRIEVMPK